MNKKHNFYDKLAMGIAAEDAVYTYLINNNDYVQDLRQQKHAEFAGPKLVGRGGNVILPDFVVYNCGNKESYAVDVKAKKHPYTIKGKLCFTIDSKLVHYEIAAEVMRLDFLAVIFVLDGHKYFYKSSDFVEITQFDNEYGTGDVFCYEVDKSRIVV